MVSVGLTNPSELLTLFIVGIIVMTFIPVVATILLHLNDLTRWQYKGVVNDLKDTSPHQIRNCVKCGRRIPWDAYLCPYCGHDYR